MGAGVAGGAAGVYTGDFVQLGQFGTILSLLRYNRGLEAEADAMGVRLLAEQGYDPRAMAETWAAIDRRGGTASARYRRKRRHRDIGLFGTHPTPEVAHGRPQAQRGRGDAARASPMTPRRARYLAAIGHDPPDPARRPGQVQRPGRQPYIDQHARPRWLERPAALHEGEIWRLRNRAGDDVRAAQGYAAAVLYPDAPGRCVALAWHHAD